MGTIRKSIFAAWLLSAAWVRLEASPFSHQRNLIPGHRAASMAGAFTAVADDPSAVHWNPAGLALMDRPEVSMSGLGLVHSETRYDETVDGAAFVERTQTYTPGFFGSSLRLGRLGLGYGFSSLDERNVNQNDSFADVELVTGETVDYYRTYQESSNLSSIGAGAAFAFSESFSAGLSAAYYRRQSAVSNFQIVTAASGAFTTRNLKFETLNEGLLGTVGLLVRSGKFRAGFSYRYPFALSDNTSVSDVLADSPGGDSAQVPGSVNRVTSLEGKTRDFDEPAVRTYQLGLAWGTPGVALLAADLIKHAPGEADGARGLQTTYNFSAGLEAGLGGIVFRGGILSNLSLYPAPATGQANQPTAIDYRGYAAGIGFTTKTREVSVGYIRQIGSGTAQMVADSLAIQNVSGSMENLLLSSRVFF
ncbi:MAG: hypothetical protein RIQ81_777 [Pseudomonadota bacterium]|jgi:long-chain fatty acid transport protein